jgi:hypothetical protein
VGGGDVLDDREPEPGTAGGSVPGRVDAVEPLEDPVQLVVRDADALVHDGDLDHVPVRLGRHQHRRVVARVGDRVGHEVGHGRGHLFLVAEDRQARRPAGDDRDVPVRGVHDRDVHRSLDHVVDVHDLGRLERLVPLQA